MAVTAAWYGKAFLSLLDKEANLNSDSLKAMLCTSTYAPNQDTHQYKSDITNEVVGAGYIAGGVALSGVSITYTGATNVIAFTSSAFFWAASTITARFAVLYDSTPATDATRPLILYINFGTDQTTNNGTFQVSSAAGGWATITVGVEA